MKINQGTEKDVMVDSLIADTALKEG